LNCRLRSFPAIRASDIQQENPGMVSGGIFVAQQNLADESARVNQAARWPQVARILGERAAFPPLH
jgi:hypothetical protein